MLLIRIPLVPHKYELIYAHKSSMKYGNVIFFSLEKGKWAKERSNELLNIIKIMCSRAEWKCRFPESWATLLISKQSFSQR